MRKALWRSTARFYAARSTAPAASRRCTWSPPGVASNASRWRRSPPTRSQTKSPPYLKLLEMLRLKGTIVTADALRSPAHDRQQIVDQGGDYALALKGNQGTLHNDVVLHLDDPASKTISAAPVVEADHGRIETRTATVSTDDRVADQRRSMARPGRCRQGRAHPRDPPARQHPRPPIICSAPS